MCLLIYNFTHSELIKQEIIELQIEFQAILSFHWNTAYIDAWFPSLLNIQHLQALLG